MEYFEAILSTEILAGILIIGAFAMGIRSTLHFTKEAADLRPKLNEIERSLAKLRDAAQERKKSVSELNILVAPIRETEAKRRLYYEELQEILLAHEREAQELGEQQEADRHKRVQRKRMNLD